MAQKIITAPDQFPQNLGVVFPRWHLHVVVKWAGLGLDFVPLFQGSQLHAFFAGHFAHPHAAVERKRRVRLPQRIVVTPFAISQGVPDPRIFPGDHASPEEVATSGFPSARPIVARVGHHGPLGAFPSAWNLHISHPDQLPARELPEPGIRLAAFVKRPALSLAHLGIKNKIQPGVTGQIGERACFGRRNQALVPREPQERVVIVFRQEPLGRIAELRLIHAPFHRFVHQLAEVLQIVCMGRARRENGPSFQSLLQSIESIAVPASRQHIAIPRHLHGDGERLWLGEKHKESWIEEVF